MQNQQAKIDLIFNALGDPCRREILDRVSKGPISVSQLAEPLTITLAAVVQHLHVLQDSGLVRTDKIGRVRTCRIEPAGFQLAEKWISDRRSLWERRYDALEELLAEPEEE